MIMEIALAQSGLGQRGSGGSTSHCGGQFGWRGLAEQGQRESVPSVTDIVIDIWKRYPQIVIF